MITCTLCDSHETAEFFSHSPKCFGERVLRKFYRCSVCFLIFLDPNLRLNPETEKKRYAEHENDITQPGYRKFLEQLWGPLNQRLSSGAEGLDFGCGPLPAMTTLAEEDGRRLYSYDAYFNPSDELLRRNYDFIVCSEVAEHLYHPGETFQVLSHCLKPGGTLGVMTWILKDESQFPDWGYHHDQTHVSFFQPKTLQWMAARWGWSLEMVSDRVALFQS